MAYIRAVNDSREYLGQIVTQDILVKDGPELGLDADADARVSLAHIIASLGPDLLRIRYIEGVGELLCGFGKT